MFIFFSCKKNKKEMKNLDEKVTATSSLPYLVGFHKELDLFFSFVSHDHCVIQAQCRNYFYFFFSPSSLPFIVFPHWKKQKKKEEKGAIFISLVLPMTLFFFFLALLNRVVSFYCGGWNAWVGSSENEKQYTIRKRWPNK